MSQIHTACLQVFASTSRERYSLTGARKQINVGRWDTSCRITANHTIFQSITGGVDTIVIFPILYCLDIIL